MSGGRAGGGCREDAGRKPAAAGGLRQSPAASGCVPRRQADSRGAGRACVVAGGLPQRRAVSRFIRRLPASSGGFPRRRADFRGARPASGATRWSTARFPHVEHEYRPISGILRATAGGQCVGPSEDCPLELHATSSQVMEDIANLKTGFRSRFGTAPMFLLVGSVRGLRTGTLAG